MSPLEGDIKPLCRRETFIGGSFSPESEKNRLKYGEHTNEDMNLTVD